MRFAKLTVLALAFGVAVSAAPQKSAAPAEPPIVRVRMTTSAGVITLAIDVRHAPKTSANFLMYVDDGRLDGTRFYRAARRKGAPNLGFVQGGIDTDARRRLEPVPLEPTSKTGLSNVTVEQIRQAQKHFPVATVQNKYSMSDATSEAVLDYCEGQKIGFIPWRPIAGGTLEGKPEFKALCDKYGATPAQLALAWMLQRSPVMLPIPGTGKVEHIEENTGAASIALSAEDFAVLDSIRP